LSRIITQKEQDRKKLGENGKGNNVEICTSGYFYDAVLQIEYIFDIIMIMVGGDCDGILFKPRQYGVLESSSF
jgi:hypothetical protein